jgi:glycosyltransferase involved in cell wall biosynthesis
VIRCYWRIYRYLRSGAFDLVHTHGYFADIMGVPASKILGIPHLSTCHGFIDNDANVKMYNLLDRFALRFSDRIIAVSDAIRNELMKKGIRSSRIVMIQNAVNGEWPQKQLLHDRQEKRALLGLGDAVFVAGYAGRLSEEKGLRYLIQASARLRRSGIPLMLVLFGEGPQRRELEDLARSEGTEQAVLFAGFVKDVENWLPALDVFVLPSLTEGTPMALLEAMAAGIPVIASSVGGVPSMIEPGRTGILVRPGMPEDIAEALRRLHADPAQRTELSTTARQVIVAQYSIRDWVRKLESEYHALATRQSETPAGN